MTYLHALCMQANLLSFLELFGIVGDIILNLIAKISNEVTGETRKMGTNCTTGEGGKVLNEMHWQSTNKLVRESFFNYKGENLAREEKFDWQKRSQMIATAVQHTGGMKSVWTYFNVDRRFLASFKWWENELGWMIERLAGKEEEEDGDEKAFVSTVRSLLRQLF